MKDSVLIAIVLAVIVVLSAVLFFAFKDRNDPSPTPVSEILLTATAYPNYETNHDTGEGAADEPFERQALRLYLDVSHPMGGFLPIEEGTASSQGIRAVAQMVPDQLVRFYGRTEDEIQWITVARELSDPLPELTFERRLFRGSQTRLDLALNDALAVLGSGRAKVTALVTDLVATHDLTGAMAVSKALKTWMGSPEVLAGTYDVGLLGVRADYWGVTSTSCSQRNSGLGCWYSERAKRYIPMTRSVERPFYILILGRSQREGDANVAARESLIDRIGRSLEQDAKSLGLEVHWELLTEFTRPRPGFIRCLADKGEKQHTLWRSPAGHFKCQQSEMALFLCGWKAATDNDSADADLVLTSGDVNWKLELRIDDGEMILPIDCERLRQSPPPDDLRFHRVTGRRTSASESWKDWSCASDEVEDFLHQTLRLDLFVTSLKPESYRIEAEEAILKAPR